MFRVSVRVDFLVQPDQTSVGPSFAILVKLTVFSGCRVVEGLDRVSEGDQCVLGKDCTIMR
jgi:hypothetical protein